MRRRRRKFPICVKTLVINPGVYKVLQPLIIFPPAFDFLPRNASYRVIRSMVFFP